MKVKEVIDELQKLNPELECIMAINQSPGFEDADIVEYCIRYCNSFVHKPSITVNTTLEIINIMVSNYNN